MPLQLTSQDLPQYTYEDYLNWDGSWELIEGIPYAMSPAPGLRHQLISNKIARYLDEALEECDQCTALLPIDWKIDNQTIVQPDNLVICFPAVGTYITKAPSIIFEILSPSTSLKDRNLKYRLYEQEGVMYYCLIEPADNIAKIYQLNHGKYSKVQDVIDETITFELQHCNFLFPFGAIWEN